LKAEVDLKNIQTELAQLGHPQTPFARELKPRFDWTRRVVAALSFDQDSLSSVRRQEGEATVTRSRAADLTGNGNHALVYGPTWSGSGKFDGCYQFAADRQHLSLGKTVGGFNLSDFTISAWVKPTAPPPPPEPAEPAEGESEDAPAPPPNESVILGSSEQSSSPRWWWLSTRRFAWRAGSDRDDAVVKSVAFELPLDQWTHVAVVRKGGKVTAFADGKPIATTDEFHTGSLPVYSWGLMVGAAARGSGSRARWDHFHGAIDDLVIWKQALTAPDILQMHELAVAGESAAAAIAYDHRLREAALSRTPATWPAGALLHLSFDQAPIAHFADRSGSRHHARLRGATWKKAGKRGGAFYADGGYGHGLIPSTPKLNLPGEMTLSVWVNLSRWDEGGGICAKGKAYNEAWALDVQEEDKLRFFRRTPDAKTYQKVISSQPLTRDKWHHILAVADDRMLRIYVDGQITRGEKHGGKFLQNDEPVSIGARYDRNGRAKLNVRGLIDELAIWDRVLTSTEMKQIYEAGAGSGN
ncbi:MAG: LamG domain-containing protein, partial [Phycisphaerae bacterium]|nr:LamG domain-containing protein [Phycisphaerae bacterium]